MIRNRYVLLADLPLIVLAAYGAFALRFEWRFYDHRPEFVPYVAMALTIKPLVFYGFGLYRRVWRYAGIHDLLTVTAAVSASTVALAAAIAVALMLDPLREFSRAVVVADWLLTLACVGGWRLSIRLLSERSVAGHAAGDRKRLLIVGAGDAGAMIAREIGRTPGPGMVAVGFLDDEPAKRAKWIHGVQVLGPLSLLEEAVSTHAVDEVVIALPRAPGSLVRTVAETCHRLGVRSRMVPGPLELLDGQVSFQRIRRVEITDLLRREPVRGEIDASSYVAGRTVLITGAGGSIGQELCRQLAKAGPRKIVLLGHGENSLVDSRTQLQQAFPQVQSELALVDIRDAFRLQRVFREHRPDLVVHAAAHKHVPVLEDHPEEAVSNNVIGTRNVVEASLSVDVSRLIMISTDKAVAPRSVMGASKRVAEMVVRDVAIRRSVAYGVVRFGNVLGSRGSVVPLFQNQIERGGPVTITDPEMKRFFMTIPEAVHLVLQAGGLVKGGELFVLEMGEPVKIVDLARDMIRLSSRVEDDIQIVFTGPRPGEKLEETLWDENSRVERTAHPHVLRVTEPDTLSSVEIARAVDRLMAAAECGDRLGVQHALAEAIPSYLPTFV